MKSENIEDLMQVELPPSWGGSPKMLTALQASLHATTVKHALYAAIPLVCKGRRCVYADTCPLLAQDQAPEGERCPIEISHILTKFKNYTDELGIDQDNIIDMTLIKDLIDIDVQLNRADARLAIDGDFIQMITIGISNDGDEIQQPAIHKAAEFKDKLLKKRHDVLGLLHSTRKDKAGDKLTITLDPSTYAAQIMAKAAQMSKEQNELIDITPEGDG